MSEPPTIYLHIGHGKVASSTIQSFLSSNADAIREQGLLVADVNFEFPLEGPVHGYPFQILLDWFNDKENGQGLLREALEQLVQVCRDEGYRGAIISSEMLSPAALGQWFSSASAPVSMRGIYYVRRQDQWLESYWKQLGLKDGTPLEEFVENAMRGKYPDFLRSALGWRNAIDDLTVCPIEGVENVQAHFSEWCGLRYDQLQPVGRANQTFDWALLDSMSRNPFLFEHIDDNRLFHSLEYLMPDDAPRDGHGMLSADQLMKIYSAYKDQNSELRQEFFPNLPECDWDRPPVTANERGRMDDFGSMDSVFRNLGIHLMLLRTIRDQLALINVTTYNQNINSLRDAIDRVGESMTRRFNRLRTRIEKEESRRQALEKRVEKLENRSLRGRWKTLRKKMKKPPAGE